MNRQWWNDSPGKMFRRLNNVWLHDVTDRMRLRRRAIASADGTDPEEVETYPMHGDVTIVHQGGGAMKSIASAAALLALGGAGGLIGAGALKWLDAKEANPPAAPPPAVKQIVEPQDYRIQFWLEEDASLELQPINPADHES